MCKIPIMSAARSTEPSCKPGGESQTVPRLAMIRLSMPGARRVTSDSLPRTSTQILISDGGVLQGITPLLEVHNWADRPDQPRPAEDISSFVGQSCSQKP